MYANILDTTCRTWGREWREEKHNSAVLRRYIINNILTALSAAHLTIFTVLKVERTEEGEEKFEGN